MPPNSSSARRQGSQLGLDRRGNGLLRRHGAHLRGAATAAARFPGGWQNLLVRVIYKEGGGETSPGCGGRRPTRLQRARCSRFRGFLSAAGFGPAEGAFRSVGDQRCGSRRRPSRRQTGGLRPTSPEVRRADVKPHCHRGSWRRSNTALARFASKSVYIGEPGYRSGGKPATLNGCPRPPNTGRSDLVRLRRASFSVQPSSPQTRAVSPARRATPSTLAGERVVLTPRELPTPPLETRSFSLWAKKYDIANNLLLGRLAFGSERMRGAQAHIP